MNPLFEHYQTVIEHVAIDIEKLRKNDKQADPIILKMLLKRQTWLVQRRNSLINHEDTGLIRLKQSLERYLSVCNNFWKNTTSHISEERMDELFITVKDVTAVYTLSGFNAYYAVFLLLKRLRHLVPPPHYKKERKIILNEMEAIKSDCMAAIKIYNMKYLEKIYQNER